MFDNAKLYRSCLASILSARYLMRTQGDRCKPKHFGVLKSEERNVYEKFPYRLQVFTYYTLRLEAERWM